MLHRRVKQRGDKVIARFHSLSALSHPYHFAIIVGARRLGMTSTVKPKFRHQPFRPYPRMCMTSAVKPKFRHQPFRPYPRMCMASADNPNLRHQPFRPYLRMRMASADNPNLRHQPFRPYPRMRMTSADGRSSGARTHLSSASVSSAKIKEMEEKPSGLGSSVYVYPFTRAAVSG